MSSEDKDDEDGQRVEFHASYKRGHVYVFPQIKMAKVKKAFKEKRDTETPIDQVLPGTTAPKPLEVDNTKLEKSMDNFKGDRSEAEVVKLLYESLSEAAEPQDLPCFLFVGLELGGKEKDIVIFHRMLGVIVVETKSLANGKDVCKIWNAAKQVSEARDGIKKEMQMQAAVHMMVAFPNIGRKQQQDVEDALKTKNFESVHPICGTEAADYKAWLRQRATQAVSEEWKGQPDGNRAFVAAVKKYLRVESYSDCEGTLTHAGLNRTWLLTPDQAGVLHHENQLLHLWGPPGAGKTLLLLHRAKRWLAEGKPLVLAVGECPFSVLLEHLSRATGNKQQRTDAGLRMALCRDRILFEATVEELMKRQPGKDVCVVIDEAHADFLTTALQTFEAKKMSHLWTAGVEDIPDELLKKFGRSGGHSVLLEHSLRCPPHIADQANTMMVPAKKAPRMSSYPHLRAVHLTASVKSTYHPFHPGRQQSGKAPSDIDINCVVCEDWLTSFLSPLADGLPKDDEKWRQWIVLGTGSFGDDSGVEEAVVAWLQRLGVPAMWEPPFQGTSNLPVSRSSEEDAAWRERLASGLDQNGRPAVHVVDGWTFLGMEKSGVLIVHFDHRDDHPDHQGEGDQEERLAQHRKDLFHAMTRSHSELAVCFLSPSPAASLVKELEPQVRIRREKRRQGDLDESAKVDEMIIWTFVVLLLCVCISIWKYSPF